MTESIRVQFERLSAPVFHDLPIRVSVTGEFTRRGGALFSARVGGQALRGVSFQPDGTGFVGYLAAQPRAGDALVLKRGSLEVETGVRFQAPAGASASFASGGEELLYDPVIEDAPTRALDAPPVQEVTVSQDGRSVTVGTCTATRQSAVWTRPNLTPVPEAYRFERAIDLDADALADFRRLRDLAVSEGVITAGGPYLKVMSGHRAWASEASLWKQQLHGRFRALGAPCVALWDRIAAAIDRTSAAMSTVALPHGRDAWADRFVRELASGNVDLTPCGGSTEAIARREITAGRRFKAVPGTGMHMTGRAVDLYLGHHPDHGSASSNPTNVAWQRQRPWFQWLVCNASRCSFHPYPVEPWHWEHAPRAS